MNERTPTEAALTALGSLGALMFQIHFTKQGGNVLGVLGIAAVLIFLVVTLIVGIRTGKLPRGRFGGGHYYRSENPSQFRSDIALKVVLIVVIFAFFLISLDQFLGLPVPNLGNFYF
jgi:hypothetical protein